MNVTDEDSRHFIAQIQLIISNIRIITDVDQCINFISNINDKNIFMIVSGSLGQNVVPLIHAMPQLVAVYVFCEDFSCHKQWTRKLSKVKGVFKEADALCKALKSYSQKYACDFTSISLPSALQNSNRYSSLLGPSFIYSKLLVEILLEIEYREHDFKDFVEYYRTQLDGTSRQLAMLDEFEKHYCPESSINWYTRSKFLYLAVNKALRTNQVDLLIKMGFFIRDMHRRIEHLFLKQRDMYGSHQITIYRGQIISKADFNRLHKSVNGYISFNQFLSTTTNRDVAVSFASGDIEFSDTVRTLFEIEMNPSTATMPFASIRSLSEFEEEDEILFSVNSVLYIIDINQTNEGLWCIKLSWTNETDQQLNNLAERLREEIQGSTAWHRLGYFVIQLGEYSTAEEIYAIFLDHISDSNEEAKIYFQLGLIKDKLGQYVQAISFYTKSVEIFQAKKTLHHIDLAVALSSIGTVYRKIVDYSKALFYCEKALDIAENALPTDSPSLATSYNNIGNIYIDLGEYSKALSFYEKALNIFEISLPKNHPTMAKSYNSIGMVYYNLSDYLKSISFYKQAIDICEKSLPPNHPDMVQSFNNLALANINIGKYGEALLYFEKALRIHQQSLTKSHPDLGQTYNNIGLVYCKMNDFLQASVFYKRALEIYKKSLPLNHPYLAQLYENIGRMHKYVNDQETALKYFDKVVTIRRKVLPPNHPDLARSLTNIGNLYYKMDKYSSALPCTGKKSSIRNLKKVPRFATKSKPYFGFV
ncbi:unnamed protein product [Rotaria socialis]|uniref:NAD(P)(+)--arginine ADP-ribosyltransferase n=1 Tax=Rotaria socialis TaxID=392032 RepID=A0A820EWM8_9BILA|nr:unnamed protein product [Rotaria socialis]CAF4255220.1 unnamed protein product [Rotaria socialis]